MSSSRVQVMHYNNFKAYKSRTDERSDGHVPNSSTNTHDHYIQPQCVSGDSFICYLPPEEEHTEVEDHTENSNSLRNQSTSIDKTLKNEKLYY